jgi:hypothetical protein
MHNTNAPSRSRHQNLDWLEELGANANHWFRAFAMRFGYDTGDIGTLIKSMLLMSEAEMRDVYETLQGIDVNPEYKNFLPFAQTASETYFAWLRPNGDSLGHSPYAIFEFSFFSGEYRTIAKSGPAFAEYLHEVEEKRLQAVAHVNDYRSSLHALTHFERDLLVLHPDVYLGQPDEAAWIAMEFDDD